MEEKLVNIMNEMAEYLNISQLKKLQEVLLKQLSDKAPQMRTPLSEITSTGKIEQFLR